jgi:hypothetical protein
MVLTTLENHERAMKNLHPYVQAVIHSLMEKKKCFGLDLVKISTLGGNAGEYFWQDLSVKYSGEIPEECIYEGEDAHDGYSSRNEAFGLYKQEINKDKDNVLTDSQDF